MIFGAPRTGFMEGDGKHDKQPRIEIRPWPGHSIDGRVHAVASSDDSVVSAAKSNARMVMFADRPWPMRMPAMGDAEHLARPHMGKFVESNFYRYDLLGEHFSSVKGYDAHARKIALAREIGMDGIVSAFMRAAVWGTR